MHICVCCLHLSGYILELRLFKKFYCVFWMILFSPVPLFCLFCLLVYVQWFLVGFIQDQGINSCFGFWYIHKMESYSTTKMNEVLIYAATWINPKNLLNKLGTQTQTLWFHLYGISTKGKGLETESILEVSRELGKGEWEPLHSIKFHMG